MKPKTTRENLLRAATQVFSQKGFSGARVDEIAEMAKANKAMIYYHFGTKEGLYQAVLLEQFSFLHEEIGRVVRAEAEPWKRLLAFYGRLVRTFAQRPALPQIMVREILSGGRHLGEDTARAISGVFQFVRENLERGAAEGAFRPVNPLLTHLTFLGPVILYFISGDFRARLMPVAAPGMEPPKPEDLVDHLSEFIARSLASDRPSSRA